MASTESNTQPTKRPVATRSGFRIKPKANPLSREVPTKRAKREPNIVSIDGVPSIEYAPGEFYPIQPSQYPSESARVPTDTLVPAADPILATTQTQLENQLKVSPTEALDSVLGFFTPVGWGTGIKLSGLTSTKILTWIARVIDDEGIDPRIGWQILREFLDHSREVLRLSGYIKGSHNKVVEMIQTPDGMTLAHSLETSNMRLDDPSTDGDAVVSARSAALATEAALRASMGNYLPKPVEVVVGDSDD